MPARFYWPSWSGFSAVKVHDVRTGAANCNIVRALRDSFTIYVLQCLHNLRIILRSSHDACTIE